MRWPADTKIPALIAFIMGTNRTGESFTDIGCGDVHLVRNEGNAEAVDVAVQIVPAGADRRIEEDQPANCPVITCP